MTRLLRGRRALRRFLHENAEADDITTLHRSGESRYIFQRAGRRTIAAANDELTLVHLLEEILRTHAKRRQTIP